MSATRKPAPSDLCLDCGQPRDASTFHFEAPGTNWGAALHHYRAPSESGAPLQPGATQPERDGVAHEPAPMTAAHIPLGGSVEHRLYSKAELTTLLERMARLVVQEAAKHYIVYIEYPEPATTLDRNKFGRYVCTAHDCGWEGRDKNAVYEHFRALLTPEKLQQLREAVERP